MLRDFSLRDFGASLNTVESYTNESSQGKIGLCETVNKQKCTHLGMFLASVLTMKLYPTDTIDLQPFSYLFSFSYMPHKGEDCYTYATGIFNLFPAVGTIRDLNESFAPVTPETPTESDQSDIPTESGDTNDN